MELELEGMLEAEASLARSRHALEVFSHVALCTYERVYETVYDVSKSVKCVRECDCVG